MYYQGQDGYREGGSPLSSVPPTRYIPGLGVEKGRTNRIADTICPVRPGSRPNCAGSCGGGCTNQVKMGTGRVVPPSHRCPCHLGISVFAAQRCSFQARRHRGKELDCQVSLVRTTRITAKNVTNQPPRTVRFVVWFVRTNRARKHPPLARAPAPHLHHHAERIFSGLDRALTAPHSMHRQPA